MSALAIIRVPNVWRRSWKRSGRRPARCSASLVAPAQRRAVEIAAGHAREDQVVVADQVLALAELRERLGDVRRHRHRADLARLRRRQLPRRSSSRAPGSPSRRSRRRASAARAARPVRSPVNAAVRKIAASCSDAGRAHQRPDLLRREHLDVAAPTQWRLLDVGDRVHRQPVHLPRPLEDPVQQHQRLGPRASPIRSIEPDQRSIAAGVTVLERQLAERRQQLRLESRR